MKNREQLAKLDNYELAGRIKHWLSDCENCPARCNLDDEAAFQEPCQAVLAEWLGSEVRA